MFVFVCVLCPYLRIFVVRFKGTYTYVSLSGDVTHPAVGIRV